MISIQYMYKVIKQDDWREGKKKERGELDEGRKKERKKEETANYTDSDK